MSWEITEIDKPENYTWAVAIDKLEKLLSKIQIKPNILFIVDSDLGNYDAFN